MEYPKTIANKNWKLISKKDDNDSDIIVSYEHIKKHKNGYLIAGIQFDEKNYIATLDIFEDKYNPPDINLIELQWVKFKKDELKSAEKYLFALMRENRDGYQNDL